MEFVAGLIGGAALVLAYLQLKAQLKQTDKRLHYVRYVSSLVLSRNELTREAVEFYLNGQRLINPHVYRIKVENTGSAPIVPADFESPILIRCTTSLFVAGVVSWNRTGVMRPEQNSLAGTARELRLGPMLLNPRDALRLTILVQVAEDDLSISGRLAGVEQILQIPPMGLGPTAGLYLANEYWPDRKAVRADVSDETTPAKSNSRWLSCMKFTLPLVANLDGEVERLIKGVEVRLHGKLTNSPSVISYSLDNESTEVIAASDSSNPLLIRSRQSEFRHAHARKLRNLNERSEAEEEVSISLGRHKVHIEPITLAPGDVLHVELIVDGLGDDLEIESPVPIVEAASFVPRQGALMSSWIMIRI